MGLGLGHLLKVLTCRVDFGFHLLEPSQLGRDVDLPLLSLQLFLLDLGPRPAASCRWLHQVAGLAL